jgi:bifunctional UDP-N-acetylglucosamine pyrophosphorylase/glucosamine-1-phosphate N-acetyltransferase
MKSDHPKVLHQILDKPLLGYTLEAAKSLEPLQIVVVVGHQADRIKTHFDQQLLPNGRPVEFAVQSPQLGTGHAVQQGQALLETETGPLLVVPADLPLLTTQTFRNLVQAYERSRSPLVMLTVEADDPRGFGRVVRDNQGFVSAIVEEADCTPAQKAIRELNVGTYIFDSGWLWQNLAEIPLSAKGEYYLTDLVSAAVGQGQKVQAEVLADPTEAIGVNDRIHLAEAGRAFRQRINHKWMQAGVTIIDPTTTYIGMSVTLGQDTIVYPNTHLYDNTEIGSGCVVGPDSFISNSTIGNGCEIRYSVVEGAVLEDRVDIGPFARLRKGAHLASGVHMGNFGEVKNSYLGPGTKMGHFSYVGDTTTGENVNVGAGTVTCNYDGEKKHSTVIGDEAFIGSDTMLVAPVIVGKNARTGAGAVVTQDIADDSLAYGVPARVKKSTSNEKQAK